MPSEWAMFTVRAESTCVTLDSDRQNSTLSMRLDQAKQAHDMAEPTKLDFTCELESKRIDNAHTRKLVWAAMGTSLAMLSLLLLNRFHPNPVIRWVLGLLLVPYAYCLSGIIRKARKIKSILPPDMESKRIRIGKRHNSLVLILMSAVGVLPIATMWAGAAFLHGYHNAIVVMALLLMVLSGGYGLYRIIEHDNAMCRQLGYMCPNCHKPLYEAHAATYLNGLCPKCKKSIFSGSPPGHPAMTL
jgi:phage FluMu protein Com